MKLLIKICKSLRDLFISVVYYHSISMFLCNYFNNGLVNLLKNNCVFPHPIGIVIGKRAQIGKKCVIYQNVTIGTKEFSWDSKDWKYPVIEDNVIIYPNSVIIGDITIGANSIIGANSFVNKSFPRNSVIVGNPARQIN